MKKITLMIASALTAFGLNAQVADTVPTGPGNSPFDSLSVSGPMARNVEDTALMPLNLGFEESASIPLVGLTTYQALVDVAKLSKGCLLYTSPSPRDS